MKKLPPYSTELVEKHKWGNSPFLVIVCMGAHAWYRAKKWNKSPNNISAIVCPHDHKPMSYLWPIHNCMVVVERLPGPSDADIVLLVTELLKCGSSTVLVWNKNDTRKFIWYRAKVTEC